MQITHNLTNYFNFKIKKQNDKEIEQLSAEQQKQIVGGYNPAWKCITGTGTYASAEWFSNEMTCKSSCPPTSTCVYAIGWGARGF